MSKFILALAIVASGINLSSAQEVQGPFGGGYGYYDAYAPQSPPGMRFSGANTAIMVGNMAQPTGCGGCASCAGGMCVDWKLVSWYASWDGNPHTEGYGNGRGCANGACGY